MNASFILAPSLLAADHANLTQGARAILNAGARWAHFDVMDGHFVPNINFGPKTLADLKRNVPDLFYDVHLMLTEPHRYVDAYADAGADLISIHIEPDYDHEGCLKKIRDLGCQNGIVLNPGTDAKAVFHLLDQVDLVLVMTVQPGYGGQSFKNEMLHKIRVIDQKRHELGLSYRLEVDGGVDSHTGVLCREAGADTFVAGTAFYKSDEPSRFRNALETVTDE